MSDTKLKLKLAWTPPTMSIHGTVKEITATGCDKMYGSGDGFTFGGQAIVCRS